jgi:hypothetical protein
MSKLRFLKSPHELYLFRGTPSGEEHLGAYLKTYECWKEVWEKVYRDEMKLTHTHFSDDFLRQDEIVALFTEGKCVGMAFMRFCDLRLLPFQQDSYFRYWPPQKIEEVLHMGNRVSLASYFTVHPDFRQVREPVCWKELLLSLFVDAYCEHEVDVMITAARKLRSNEKLCQKLNAKVLAENVPFTIDGKEVGELTDLVYWPREKISLKSEWMEELRKDIWNKRIIANENSKGERYAA